MPLGTQLYGRVHHLDRVGSIATKFAHFAFIPIYPIQSYLVAHDSEHDLGFDGVPIPLEPLSVAVGYAHGWLLLVSYVGTLFGVAASSPLLHTVQSASPIAQALTLLVSVGTVLLCAATGAIPYLCVSFAGPWVFTASPDQAARLSKTLDQTVPILTYTIDSDAEWGQAA